MKNCLILFLLFFFMTACRISSHEPKNRSREPAPTWDVYDSTALNSMIYKPCSIIVDWLPAPDSATSTREKSGRGLVYTETTGAIGRYPYIAYHLVKSKAEWSVEVAVNEKEVVVKIVALDSAARKEDIAFRVYFLPGNNSLLENNRDIMVADCPGEKMFFHHYGQIIESPHIADGKEVMVFDSGEPVYFYSGDERSVIYLDDLIARKRLEYEKLTRQK